MINRNKIEQSNVNRAYEDEEDNGDKEEGQSDDEKLDQIQQMELMENAIGDGISKMSNEQKRVPLLRKIPCFRQSEKPKTPEIRRLKLSELYRYADRLDILLMIIGTITALLTGAIFPILIFLYGTVINNLLQMGKLQTTASIPNITSVNFTECSVLSNNDSSIESPHDAIAGVIKYYAIIGSLSVLFHWIAWSCWIIAAERQIRRMRYALFRNILRQEMGWFDVHNSGELTNHLIADLEMVKDGINDNVPDFISLFARVVGTLMYSLIIAWKLTLVFLSVSPLLIITFNRIVKITIKYTNKETQAFGLASSVAQEVLQNIRTVTAFHGQEKEEQRFGENLISAKRIAIRKNLYLGFWQGLVYFILYSSYTLTFWYGPHLVRTDCAHYSAGKVLMVFMSCMFTTVSAAYLSPNIQNFAEALANGRRVFDVIDRETKIDASSDQGDQPENIIGDIRFDNVTFTYPARQETPILKTFSLKIPAGKTVALVGESGSGKSTIIQLIQRFYDPDDGQICLDGKDIKRLNVSWLRSHIGIVSQEPVLFTGSIEDNIRFGKSDATDEEVQNAAKMANAHDFIMDFPENYKTVSGEKLSGGQKQRVAIARAVISNPKILLLDEATSALDNTSERTVRDALNKAKEGRTTIIIAHRLSTIQDADIIIGLENGQVIEYGDHEELIKQKGLYYRLVKAQNEREKAKVIDSDSDEEPEPTKEELIRQKSAIRQFSKQTSILSDRWEKLSEINPSTTIDDSQKKTNCFHRSLSWKILKLNSPEWFWFVVGGISSIIFSAVPPVFALFLSEILGLFAESNVEEQKRLTTFYTLAIFFAGLLGGIAQFLILYGFAKSGEALTMRMRKLTFSAILRQEISFFDSQTNSIGTLLTRLSADTSALKGMTGTRFSVILQGLSATIAALIVSFIVGWKLTLVVLCFAPLMMLTGLLQGKKQNDIAQSKDKGSLVEQGGQYATEAIEHIRTVVGLHQEKYFIHLYENIFDQEFRKQMWYLHLRGIGSGIANSMVYFLHMTTFAYGNQLVEKGEMEFNHVIRILFAISFAMISTGRCMAVMSDYSKARKAALGILELDQRKSQINPHDQSGVILNDVEGNIQFDDVQFRYANRPNFNILRHFSLKCSAGQTTALVGPSGSGKSTTIALLQRFYDPSKGRICLDGHDLKILNLRWLRSLMGFVQQEPVLFNLSIRDNIAYGDHSRQLTQEQIETAARMANIHQFITSLPKGYETLCGAKGSQLSGGQKQRIAIARALIRSPKILLFDEATSALDSQSEMIVQQAISNATSGRTSLTIAHRLSTIQHSDKIVVVDRGKIREEGKHDELLQLNGIYAKLALIQKKSENSPKT